jgi:hypothetical protein
MTYAAVGLALLQVVPIGSALSTGTELTYQSGDTVQPPWVYESVEVVARDGFEWCIVSVRRAQPEREHCARGDTLFERGGGAVFRAIRPIGAAMELDVPAAAGGMLRYSTGAASVHRVTADFEVAYLPTTILTVDSAGAVVRRLREHYAPALLTAVWGVFEQPDGSGGWTTIREFTLVGVRMQRP